MRRRYATAAAFLLVVFIGTGCTDTEPEPSPSTACTPDRARVTWQPLSDAEPYPVGYRAIEIAADGTSTQEDTVLDYASTTVAEPEDFVDGSWLDFLIEDVNRTGQTTQRLGDQNFEFSEATFEPETTGSFIIGYRLEQVQAPFTVLCGAITQAEGTLTTSSGGLGATLVQCGTAPVGDDPYSLELLEYCAD